MTVIKQNPPNCRRELVNAYTSKPTAKKKIWNTVKRLHIDGDKTVPSKLPSAGVWEKTCFALINAFCFGKAAGLRRKCTFAYFCCYGQKYVPRHGTSGETYSFIKVRVRSSKLNHADTSSHCILSANVNLYSSSVHTLSTYSE